jgi:carbamoyltransferase
LITAILGFRPGKDEGKITGLSAQGKFNKECMSAIKKIIYDSSSDNLMSWGGKFDDKKLPIYKVDQVFKNKLYKKISKFTREDIAFCVQYLVEKEIIKVVSYYKKLNKYKNIVLSGGIFANVRLNQKIFALGFDQIFIDPAMSDEGLSLGAALGGYFYDKSLESNRNIKNIYFGPEINGEASLLKKHNIKAYYFSSDSRLADKISRILVSGKTIAIARGRMEYGPRALGNRSILASPVAYDINNNLNKKLGRNDFMPFAPVVLDKNMYRCFSDMRGKELASKYMTITSYATKYFIKKCPQIVHVDKTARPQIVNKSFNSFCYLILNNFYKLTGIPSLINTSFNIHNQPIVCSAEDALDNFFRAKLDYLLLNRHLVSFDDNINRKFIFTNIR